jgi:hypothetical protein
MLVEQGSVDVGTMVLDTAGTGFIADEQIDLASVEFSQTVGTHPKNVSIIASKVSAYE